MSLLLLFLARVAATVVVPPVDPGPITPPGFGGGGPPRSAVHGSATPNAHRNREMLRAIDRALAEPDESPYPAPKRKRQPAVPSRARAPYTPTQRGVGSPPPVTAPLAPLAPARIPGAVTLRPLHTVGGLGALHAAGGALVTLDPQRSAAQLGEIRPTAVRNPSEDDLAALVALF